MTERADDHAHQVWLDRLADAVIGDGMGDPIAEAYALRDMLTAAAWVAVLERAEICPVHIHDAEICADDKLACPTGQPDNN